MAAYMRLKGKIMTSRYLTSAALAASLTLFTAPFAAADDADRFYAAPMAGAYLFEGDQNLDDGPAYGLGLGYNVTERWALEAVALGVDSEVEPGGGDANGLQLRVDALYDFDLTPTFSPYLAVGAGVMHLKPDPVDDPGGERDSDPLIAYGGGVKYRLTETLSLRGDLRHVVTFDRTYHNLLPTVGLIYTFGDGTPSPRMNQETASALPAAREPERETLETPYEPAPAGEPRVAEAPPPAGDAPVKVSVNQAGSLVFQGVLFDFDRASIRPEFTAVLDGLATILQRHAKLAVEVQGHTDSTGGHAYNQGLSERRANAVKGYLLEQGVAAGRLTTRGFSFDRPVADNATREGRARNRRVEIKPLP